jgi:hypothetical protein
VRAWFDLLKNSTLLGREPAPSQILGLFQDGADFNGDIPVRMDPKASKSECIEIIVNDSDRLKDRKLLSNFL